ncbi:MAG: TolC family protein [Paracoccaceae bacterium]
MDSAYEDADIWRLTLLTDVLSAYIDMRYTQELLRINSRVTQSREATVAAAQKITSEIPGAQEIAVAQSKSLLANSRAQRPDIEVLFAQSLNRIMRLVGVTELPKRGQFDRRAPQPIPKTKIVQTGVPSDLLRNRPDVVRAERRFEQAMAAVGVAQAEMYPGLILTGNIALNDSSNDKFVSAGFFRVGIDIPLFDLPVRRGRKAAAIALAEERRLEWEKQVIESVEEVRNAMFAMERHRIAIIETEVALEAAEKVLEIARREYQAGSLTFIQVQDAERGFLSSENALALDKCCTGLLRF